MFDLQWMAKPSWWQDTGSGPSLKHQKAPSKEDSPIARLDAALMRKGKAAGPAATRFRKGACQNCGAMTHSRKDCLERPRKVGAAWSGQDIAPDEIVLDEDVKGNNWDAKRDKWAGYDPVNHQKVVVEHEALEEARRRFREEELDKTDLKTVQKVARTGKGKDKDKAKEDDDFGSSDESADDDETKYADAADAAGQKLDTKNVRLRIGSFSHC
jgi:pre-mRNA-processing factor SLU7